MYTFNIFLLLFCNGKFGFSFFFHFIQFLRSTFYARAVPMIFFSSVVYGMICFFFLAMKWGTLMIEWEKIENGLPKLQKQCDKRKLAHKVRMLTIVMMMLSLCKQVAFRCIQLTNLNSKNVCSRTCVEHYYDCSLFKFMSNSAQGSDHRVFQGSFESAVRFYRIRAVESIFG